ncbi:hypothetical protein VC116059_003071B, partial [Vibrio cholerae O1 str. 116059]
FA